MPGIVSRRQAEVFAKRVIGGFARPFMLANQAPLCDRHLGITLCPNDGGDGDELLPQCRAGPVRRQAPGTPPRHLQRLHAGRVSQRRQMHDLAEAIKLGQLTMAYQPIWDNRSGRVAKLEALVRWYHPHWGQGHQRISSRWRKGGAHPGGWVPWCCGSLAGIWPDCSSPASRICRCPSTAPPGVPDHGPEASRWLQVIRHFELDPADIIIGSPNLCWWRPAISAGVRIDALREAGCKLAIDDFGTGLGTQTCAPSRWIW